MAYTKVYFPVQRAPPFWVGAGAKRWYPPSTVTNFSVSQAFFRAIELVGAPTKLPIHRIRIR
ncbi:hypothetical protein CH373_04150 [Leptospira perolatii]|uniref:Uncharacterized protein n=1 Tax=Leptospira perolatii TaxID=2023191 RepID=A0A2M9ZQ81_9LEPT|nr:hypothetical protein CH360_13180 [Leptospira perolatii]PJZ74121.1 hypothetical protein CH373_04150 [Leptospira perolatii]